MTGWEFRMMLESADPVFKDNLPKDMTFREPDTLKPYRGLFRKTGENKWKLVVGNEQDLINAKAKLDQLGIKHEPVTAPEYMFAVGFDGPEGA